MDGFQGSSLAAGATYAARPPVVTAADAALCGEHGEPLRWVSGYQGVTVMRCARGCSTDSVESAPDPGLRLYFTPDARVYVVEA